MYGSVNDRMRAMDRERLETLTGAGGTLLSAADVPASGRERLTPGRCPTLHAPASSPFDS